MIYSTEATHYLSLGWPGRYYGQHLEGVRMEREEINAIESTIKEVTNDYFSSKDIDSVRQHLKEGGWNEAEIYLILKISNMIYTRR